MFFWMCGLYIYMYKCNYGHAHQLQYVPTNLGNALTSLKKSIVNLLGPSLPLSALNPSKGTLDMPVTNWSRRSLCSLSNISTACQNQRTTWWAAWQPIGRILYHKKWKFSPFLPPALMGKILSMNYLSYTTDYTELMATFTMWIETLWHRDTLQLGWAELLFVIIFGYTLLTCKT